MMTIQATQFTPEVLLTAPRRSAGIPNSTGELVLYTVSTYSFETHTRTSQIRVFNIRDGTSHLISQDPTVYEPVWLSELEVAFLRPTDSGCTALIAQHVYEPPAETPSVIQSFAGSLANPKLKPVSSDRVLFCCSAPTKPNGELHWPSAKPKPHSSGKVYSHLFVRHWDTWGTENQNSLWFGVLVKANGHWSLETPSLANLLAGSRLSSPVPPFGGTGDFDISASGVIFVAKDPDLNPARHTKTDLYFIPFKAESLGFRPAPLQIVKTGKLRGYTTSPVFSKDGKKVAFARMKSDQYESDKPRLMLIPDVNDLTSVQEFYETRDDHGGWSLRPDWITWSNDDRKLLVAAEKHGKMVLWALPASTLHAKHLPESIYETGSVVEARTLGGTNSLLVSSRSRVENSSYSILNLDTGCINEISSSSKNGKSLGLSASQSGEMWFPGSAGHDIHALVMRPSNFDKSKKYPLALLIHGGPQGAWNDDWSTRWNPAVFAEQGYIVVCPNITGSTGYGQTFVDAVTKNWGGNPYKDLVKCFEYLETEVDFVDTDRAVALGASYGGYMIRHDLGRRFKALVCHDGIFSTPNLWTTEELFFPEHDFGGTLWENRAEYEKWDPSRHLHEWATPQLVIHSELDYRLPMSEGLAMFNALQARGVPSKLLMFPDENHWVTKPENSLLWHREVLAWINKYSGIASESTLASRTER